MYRQFTGNVKTGTHKYVQIYFIVPRYIKKSHAFAPGHVQFVFLTDLVATLISDISNLLIHDL